MSTVPQSEIRWKFVDDPLYPQTDGEPLAENTTQARWIIQIMGGLEVVFAEFPEVFIAADLFWYPVQGHPEIRTAPDVMVAFGRPKGDRGSYMQWREENIPFQVVFEVHSPGNRAGEMARKLAFYEKYGVEEYYILDPDMDHPEIFEFRGYLRTAEILEPIPEVDGWVSPRLGVRFVTSGKTFQVLDLAGKPFLTYLELAQQGVRNRSRAEEFQRRATRERRRATRQQRQAEQAQLQAEQARSQADEATRKAERLAAQLRALGIEPES